MSDRGARQGAAGITAPMILPEDVFVIPVPELAGRDRERVEGKDDQFVVTRRYARAPSKVLGRHAGGILGRFRSPIPIARAVAEYSEAHGLDAQWTLREVFPVLRSCLAARLLVPADSPASARIVPTLVPGDRVGAWGVVRCVQLLEDTEVYHAEDPDGGSVALKVLRPAASEGACAALDREAAALSRLRGEGAPALLERVDFEDRPVLVLEWCAGTPPTVIADE
ncbi:MAG: hypothetical protein ACRELC_11595, partial [Gemmatimonadota bacterium]